MSIISKPAFKEKYDNFIGGKFVPPVKGEYFDNISPIDGKVFTKAARSGKEDIELALDAAHAAFATWGKSSAAYRASILNKIADVIEENLEYLAVVECIDNGKAIRETRAADLPLVVDHFRYFAGVIRAEEGGISEHDEYTVSICLHEPIGVVGQIIPWNFCAGRGELLRGETCRANANIHNDPDGSDKRRFASRRIKHSYRFWSRSR
jgi:aldehyde dehydrogenase